MKTINVVNVLSVCLWLGLSACGGHGGMTPPPQTMQPPPPPPPQNVTLAVADVLAKAKSTSETDDPVEVDGEAVVVAPLNDETSDPASVE